MNPLVTIVTPCYNSAQFIEETVQSVLAQTYAHIEYIVMDGGSADGTREILERYADRLTFISEPDNGQSDAINKGWRMAKGDILAWLNADDLYLPDTVEKAVAHIEQFPGTHWVYGYSETLNADGRPHPFRHPVCEWDYHKLLNQNDYVIQPTVFLRRAVVEEMGYLREDLHYMMDYEYWLRIGKQYPGKLVPEIRVLVKRYRATKTVSGGLQRLEEMESMLRSFGAEGFPSGIRHEWVEEHLRELGRQLRHGKWTTAWNSFKALLRFPAAIPRGIVKLFIRIVLPEKVETLLRQWFVREQEFPG